MAPSKHNIITVLFKSPGGRSCIIVVVVVVEDISIWKNEMQFYILSHIIIFHQVCAFLLHRDFIRADGAAGIHHEVDWLSEVSQ